MSFENRHIFKGRIKGIRLNDFKEGLDYRESKRSIAKRKEIVEKLIEEKGEFFEDYFDNHYKVELNQNDELSEKNTVCTTLESMANYLLGSNEIREQRNDCEYRFYRDKTEFKLRTKKEESLNAKQSVAGTKVEGEKSDNDDRVIDFLLKSNGNAKKSKEQRILPEDLKEDTYCGEVLREYQFAIDEIDGKLEDIKINKNKSKHSGKRYKLTKAKKDIHYDMIYCKTHLKGTFGERLKCPLQESTEPDWNKFDWHDEKCIKALLFLQFEFEPQEDLSYLIMDLENIINELKQLYYNSEFEKKSFTKKEIMVIDYIREGYTVNEIKNMMNVAQPVISKMVKNIVEKIVEYTLDNFKREA